MKYGANMAAELDVLIVGGGIHGTGVAQAAAAAGYSVRLLEQTAIAHGTSSRSSKLIHGGLRYLETGQFSLVRESLRERRLLLELAPEIVRLVPFHIPVYKSTRRRPWQIRAGLGLYALLGGMAGDNRFSTLARSQWDSLDGLETQDLQAVFRYYDGQTDDALLTRAVMQSAQALGAELMVPARFLQARLENDRVVIEYEAGKKAESCTARVLVNAAGPWTNQVLEKISPSIPIPEIELVKGTHIRVAGSMSAGNYYMETPQDGRAVFAMPRDDSILVGTTEARFSGDPDKVAASEQEQQYLLDVLSHYFPHYQSPQNAAILSAYAGVRVLPGGEGNAFKRTRETILKMDRSQRPRVLSVYGGKLTTWRATAENVIMHLSTSLPTRKPRARTDQLTLLPA
ncbi:MAG: FAD-dependent oxidoreductase [Gammaproteobacteria bacterium]